MGKKILDIEELYTYAYCPFYYKCKGQPSNYYTDDRLITSMLTNLASQRAEYCFSGVKKFRSIYKTVLSQHKKDIENLPIINLRFKMMSKVLANIRFVEAVLLNSTVVFESTIIPIHFLVKKMERGKDLYYHIIYYYSTEPPTEHKMLNDIKITAPTTYIAETYKRSRTLILWNDMLIPFKRRDLMKKDTHEQVKRLTAAIKNDIIYKRISNWCKLCTLREVCTKCEIYNNK